jgi:hypothetical protein
MVVAFGSPARAERACAALGAAPSAQGAPAAIRVASSNASAKAPLVHVSGGGQALLTDAFGSDFPHQFSISAVIGHDASVRGRATFVFPMQFSDVWGAVPGVHLIHVDGEITGGSLDPDGKVTLVGPFVERDFAVGEGIVFEEDSRVTGVGPLQIELWPGSDTFAFTWCELADFNDGQLFSTTITNGTLSVR